MITDVSRLRPHPCTIITSRASNTHCGGRSPSRASRLDKGHQSKFCRSTSASGSRAVNLRVSIYRLLYPRKRPSSGPAGIRIGAGQELPADRRRQGVPGGRYQPPLEAAACPTGVSEVIGLPYSASAECRPRGRLGRCHVAKRRLLRTDGESGFPATVINGLYGRGFTAFRAVENMKFGNAPESRNSADQLH
jgi:hypothetical protein